MWSEGKTPMARSATLASFCLMAAVTINVAAVTVLLHPQAASAVSGSSVIQAQIRDDLPPSLTITGPKNGETIQDTSVVVEGSVHNVGQLMLYLDGNYYATSPLNAGASSFSVTVTAMVGQHALRIVGIDPMTNMQIETTIQFTCTTPPVVNEVVNNVVGQVGGVVVGAGKEIKSQVDQASGWGPMKTITDASYNALKALDLIPVSGTGSIPLTVGRFALISAGVTLTVAPWTAPFVLSRLRLVPLHTIYAPHTMARLHALGILLFLFPFMFMS